MKSYLSRFVAAMSLFAATILARVFMPTPRRVLQGGFVLLSRTYAGYLAGTVVELPSSTEATLIAAGQATASVGPPTAGNVTTTMSGGAAAVAAAASSVTITNPSITPQSLVMATISQVAADVTALYVARIVPAAGSVTIYTNAAATAVVTVDWCIVSPFGNFTSPN
jgi:hypothetical protein